jgi:dTDP-4-dehydrorhamnose 3,5-epimerase-like enzyme
MNNKEYGDLVNKKQYPEDNCVPLDPPFIDERGSIQNLWLAQSGSITFIESKKGSVRARHKHINDWHSTFIINGKIKYIEIDENNIETEYYFSDNNLFFTKPGIFHIMEFLEDTKMITINNIVKNHENYENSIIRMDK